MIARAYDDKTQFYLTDSLDAQRLYNAARNVEIAAWKLANSRSPNGELMLLSNEMSGAAANLSFEREIGKLVAYQDTLALVMAQRTNRTIRRVTQISRRPCSCRSNGIEANAGCDILPRSLDD